MNALIVWGNLEFTFRPQRPQKIATGLSSLHPVVYINPTASANRQGKLYKPAPESHKNLLLLDLPPLRFLEGNGGLWNHPLTHKESTLLYSKILSELVLNNIKPIANIIMHPAYYLIPRIATSPCVYDCMDLIHGFNNVHDDIAASEIMLFAESEASVFTSTFLYESFYSFSKKAMIIRNGYDDTISTNGADEATVFTNKVINQAAATLCQKDTLSIVYIGAIADWFDKGLLIQIICESANLPARFVFIGRDDINLEKDLKHACPTSENFFFTGELSHQDSMKLVAKADVGLIPLNHNLKLIQATNPVKAYEYLSLGLQVISNPIPEVSRLENDNIYISSGCKQWIGAIKDMISLKATKSLPSKEEIRRESHRLLASTSWNKRSEEYAELINELIDQSLETSSIDAIVPTTGSHDVLIKCVKSLCQFSFNSIIIVINGSPATRVLRGLETIKKDFPEIRLKILHHKQNIGFTDAVNNGVENSGSQNVLIVNDDMIFSPWSLLPILEILKGNHDNNTIINITTTNIDGDAYRPHSYYTLTDFYIESERRYRDYGTCMLDGKRLGMNCTMIPRYVFDSIGGIPKVSGLGYGEDDMFFSLARANGFPVVYLPGAYAHHIGSLSFCSKGISLKAMLIETNA